MALKFFKIDRHHPFLLAVGLSLFLLTGLLGHPHMTSAASGACTAPSTDYGTVTNLSVTVPVTGSYTVWSRMVAPNATDSYLLEIDSTGGNQCFTVGGSGVQTYANGATTYFSTSSSNTSDWISTNNVSLAAGTTYTLKLIGNAPSVVVDRLEFVEGTTCSPMGTGDNCTVTPDTTPPVGQITSPASTTSVTGTVPITVSASDDVAVTGVDIYDGSTKLGAASLTSGASASGVWTYNWNTTGQTVGSSHTLTAHVTDGTNTITSGTSVVTIRDVTNPTVAVTYPTANASLSGTFTATVTATDNIGVTKVEYFLDGSNTAKATSTSSPFSASIDASTLSAGTHTISAKAYDAQGNTQPSSNVTFTVTSTGGATDTTAPVVSLVGLTNGTVLNADSTSRPYNSKAYSISATASDSSGIQQVVFKVDGTVKATDTTAPYTLSYDLSTLTCGSHTVTATATDKATTPNSATSTAAIDITLAEDLSGTPDCKVTLPDFSLLAAKYGQTGASIGRADINGDGTVNLPDFSLLAAKYGQTLH